MFRKKTTAELNHFPGDRKTNLRIILLLDDIRSMHNVGSLFRTADAFGVSEMLLCGYTPAPPHRDIRKTALGAEDNVSWRSFQATPEAINWCRTTFPGCKIAVLEQAHGSIPLSAVEEHMISTGTLILILGNEVSGVNPGLMDLADLCIEIPQWGSKHSLNVSVAAGVALYGLTQSAGQNA